MRRSGPNPTLDIAPWVEAASQWRSIESTSGEMALAVARLRRDVRTAA